ncbi:hypothetical protein [Nonomuraea rubra]|uniref:hypothetical protein n=1 Tax=Nonomuraea rubra TaxID=46180 RepID=UPI0036227C77
MALASSFAPVGYSPKPLREFDQADWTDPAGDNTAYIRSKAIAERAASYFIAVEGCGLELAGINPIGIFGLVLGPRLSSSIAMVKAMPEGAVAVVSRCTSVWRTSTRSPICIYAMTHPAPSGERFLAGSTEPISFRGWAENPSWTPPRPVRFSAGLPAARPRPSSIPPRACSRWGLVAIRSRPGHSGTGLFNGCRRSRAAGSLPDAVPPRCRAPR